MTSIRRSGKATRVLSLLAALASVHAGGAMASASLEYQAIPSAAPQPLQPIGPTTREEMEAFTDGFMSVQMRSGPVAGAVVAVVKDGALFFAKGYGYEDVEKQIPVNPEQTLFRPGSVSKLFTWTAVMQLVEQGKLDLDKDVNTYLRDIKLPQTYRDPVTLRNIMTHTAGFEDGGVGYLILESDKDLLPVGEWLAKHMPARARPPTTDFSSGANASYSNWATGLAGHIVETISGMTFDEYVEQHIFQPLGMNNSTFREPLPARLAQHMSGGYVFEEGMFKRKGFEFIHSNAPAGALSATAADMAKFMLAYLQQGTLGEGKILSPETARLMFTRTLSPDPALNGSALGFYETWINGRRIIGHGGDTMYFHTELGLLPEANLGMFVSINTGGEGAITSMAFQKAFFEHYFPARLPQLKPPADASKRNARYAGKYRTLRRSYTAFEKAFAAVGDIAVVPMPDGSLFMPDPILGKPGRWIEAGNGVFRKVDDDLFIAFKGKDGEPASHLVGHFSPIAAERIGLFETGTFHGILGAICVLLFITILVSAIRQRRADKAGPANLRWARPALALAAVLFFAFLIGLVLTIAGGIEELFLRIPTTLYVALTFPLLAILPVIAAVVFTVILWRASAWRLRSRVHYTLATLAALAFLWMLNYWNLLGYRFG